jgi:hypothetical protein
MYSISHIVESGDKRIFVAEDGTEVSYRYHTKKAVWVSDEDVRGDLSILRPLSIGYQLEELPSPSKTIYAQNVQGIGFFPTQSFDDLGGSTSYQDYSGAVPTRVTDNATGKSIRLTVRNGLVETVTSYEALAGGTVPASYTLNYNAKRELQQIRGPEGIRVLSYAPTSIGLLSKVTDPFGHSVDFGISSLGRLTKVATRTNTNLVGYTANSVTTTRYEGALSEGATGTPLHVSKTIYDGSGFVKEVRSGDGAAAPGRRVITIERDLIGRLTKVRGADGEVTAWLYNAGAGRNCEPPASGVGNSQFVSCITSGGFTTSITRNVSGLPTEEIVKGPNGKGSRTTYTWNGTSLTNRTVRDSSGRVTEVVTIAYDNKFPISVTRETHGFVDQFDSMSRPTLLTGASGLQIALNASADGSSGSMSVEGLTSEFASSMAGTGDYTATFTSRGVSAVLSGNYLGTKANLSAGTNPNQSDTTIVTGSYNDAIMDNRETISESLTLSDNGGSETARSSSKVVTKPDINKTESTTSSRQGRL